MIRMKRDAQSLEEFRDDAVPVKKIIWGEEPRHLIGGSSHLPTHGPIALLDIMGHPSVHITDLARIYQTDVSGGEGAMEYAIDFWMQPDHFLVRLIFSYRTPVILEFAIVFDCKDPEHWIFLRWLAENDGAVVLADEFAGPVPSQDPRKTLLIETDIAEQLGEFLCSISLRQAEARKRQRLTGLEMITALLEAKYSRSEIRSGLCHHRLASRLASRVSPWHEFVAGSTKRYISFEDLAANAVVHLGIPIQGREKIQLKTIQGQRIPYARISQRFQKLLQRVSGHKDVGIALLDGILYLVRLDYAQEMGYVKSILPHETFEEFTAGAILIERIVDTKSLQTASSMASTLVALLPHADLPALNLSDLVQSNNEFTWALAETSDDILIRLTCTSPISFALCFRLSLHREFLRWVLEHQSRVPLARQGTDTYHVITTNDEDLAGSLRLMCIHQMLGRMPDTPETEQMIRMLFDVKRFLSLQELAIFASEMLHIQIRGDEEQMIQNAFGEPNAALLVQEISREFRIFLLQVLVLDGIVSGLYQGETYLFTEEWLAEQRSC